MTTATAESSSDHEAPKLSLVAGLHADRLANPAYQAYLVLRAAFAFALILLGVGVFFNWMTYWPKYLCVGFPHFLSVSPRSFMVLAPINAPSPRWCSDGQAPGGRLIAPQVRGAAAGAERRLGAHRVRDGTNGRLRAVVGLRLPTDAVVMSEPQ